MSEKTTATIRAITSAITAVGDGSILTIGGLSCDAARFSALSYAFWRRRRKVAMRLRGGFQSMSTGSHHERIRIGSVIVGRG
jgi:hypothetical protein